MLKFDRNGLIPTIIVDDATGETLMLAFMNQEAFERTRETGYTHFFSRSRNALWRKGEQSGNSQEVQAIFVNCEENSLLIRVKQQGGAACHMGYRSCYYRRLQPDGAYTTVADRLFDPQVVYRGGQQHMQKHELSASLETAMRPLYEAYIYLRDHDLSERSNTSLLLQEHTQSYLVSRLADELQELAGVQNGEHVHSGLQADTILEGSQVGYWLQLLAASNRLAYDDFMPHAAMLEGYDAGYSDEQVIELQQKCLNLLEASDAPTLYQGLRLGFALIGQTCARAGISPLEPVEYDVAQMRRKGLIGK